MQPHKAQLRREFVCKIPGCRNPYPGAHGLCGKHYARQVKHGDPLVAKDPTKDRRFTRPEGKTCKIPGCDKPYRLFDMCDMHARRWQRHGDPTKRCGPNDPRFVTFTPEEHALLREMIGQVPSPSYKAISKRIGISCTRIIKELKDLGLVKPTAPCGGARPNHKKGPRSVTWAKSRSVSGTGYAGNQRSQL